jgi:hypothetical protein
MSVEEAMSQLKLNQTQCKLALPNLALSDIFGETSIGI